MKKVLFICSNMGVGGFQKSLVSLLRCFDYQKYEVDLLLFNPTGIFMNLIPEEVNVIPPVIDPDYFLSAKEAVIAMIGKKQYGKALLRLISGIAWCYDKSVGAYIMVKGVPKLKKKYDVAVDYNGQQLLYYLIDKVLADKKISYFHSDYKKWHYYERMDRKYYGKVDAIVTVSDNCVKSLREVFPEYSEKTYCIENIVTDATVNLFHATENVLGDYTGKKLVSVGRVCTDKGFDFACKALRLLINDGYDVRWYEIGPVEDQQNCESWIRKYELQENMILLGATDNPYEYMREADIIVHPSRFEGKAVAVEEAKILKKPIVVTNYSTVDDQIIDGKSGLIVDMTGEDVYAGIKKLLDDKELYDTIIEYQKMHCHGNGSEMDKLYRLME